MKHQKKRNIGLVYEFLARRAASALVDGDEALARRAIRLMRRHLREGTELQREFRLFRALVGSHVPDRGTAERIVESARTAARQGDPARLDREKSLLIRDINHTLNADGTFYEARVDEYKLYATVQTLLNEWRQDVPTDIVGVAMYEAELVEHLMRLKPVDLLGENADGKGSTADDLVLRLMLRRSEGKYRDVLNGEQLRLLGLYVEGLRTGDMVPISEAVNALRSETLAAVDRCIAQGGLGSAALSKLQETRSILADKVVFEPIDDRMLAQCLRFAGLRQELDRPSASVPVNAGRAGGTYG